MTLGIICGRFVLNKIRPAQPIWDVPLDYTAFEDEGFSVIYVHAVLGNLEGSPFDASSAPKN